MPGDGFAFPIRVTGQQDGRGRASGSPELLDDAGLGDGYDILRREVPIDIDPQPVGRQIADMAKARPHQVASPEIVLDRPALGGGLDDDERLSHQVFAVQPTEADAKPTTRHAAATGGLAMCCRSGMASACSSWRRS